MSILDTSLQHFISLVFYWISVEWASILCSGEYRIRTCEGTAIRFTVWPLWPLGKLPFAKCGCKCFFLPISGGSLSGWPTCFSPLKLHFILTEMLYRPRLMCGRFGRQAKPPSSVGIRTTNESTNGRTSNSFHPAASWASGGTWTRNLLITNQPLCQLSYASGPFGPRTEQVYGFTGDVQDGWWRGNDKNRNLKNGFRRLVYKMKLCLSGYFPTFIP